MDGEILKNRWVCTNFQRINGFDMWEYMWLEDSITAQE